MLNIESFTKKLLRNKVVVFITLFIFFNPIWTFSPVSDKCGGCCGSWSRSCDFSIGFPFPFYSQGYSIIKGDVQNFSIIAIGLNIVLWIFLFKIFKKKQNKS